MDPITQKRVLVLLYILIGLTLLTIVAPLPVMLHAIDVGKEDHAAEIMIKFGLGYLIAVSILMRGVFKTYEKYLQMVRDVTLKELEDPSFTV
jgi:hypothetical protein